jgi:hypothetical protein
MSGGVGPRTAARGDGVGAVLSLAGARVWRQRASAFMIVAGVAAAAAMLSGVSVLSTTSRDASLRQVLEGLSPENGEKIDAVSRTVHAYPLAEGPARAADDHLSALLEPPRARGRAGSCSRRCAYWSTAVDRPRLPLRFDHSVAVRRVVSEAFLEERQRLGAWSAIWASLRPMICFWKNAPLGAV